MRDVEDLERHYNYIYYNPVKHQQVKCPHAWPHSSFHRLVDEGRYPVDWCCQCGGPAIEEPVEFEAIARSAGE